MGTDHPSKRPCVFKTAQHAALCGGSAEIFMFVREPVSRLWSGYRHEVKIANNERFPLERYTKSMTVVKVSHTWTLLQAAVQLSNCYRYPHMNY